MGSRAIDVLLPPSLGRDFRWLWSSSTASNLADGVLLAAGPLLVASVTLSPLAIAMAVFVQRVPWLVFGVLSGAIIDRVDRRRLVAWVNAARAVVLAALSLTIAFDRLDLVVIYAVFFILGTAETFADTAGTTLVAVVTPRAAMGIGNARLMGTHTVANQLIGPPVGALLFGLWSVLPFGTAVAGYVLAAVLVARIHLPDGDGTTAERSSLRNEVADGLRWLLAHRPIRMLAILITVFNITFGAAASLWVLYALEVLGLSEVGYGILMAAAAVGGVLGSAIFGRLEARFSYAAILRVGLLLETATHLVFATSSSVVVAAITITIFGAHASIWGTTSNTIRHRAVPAHLLGRVTSVYMIGAIGAMAIGALLGGVIAQAFGLLATFWFAGAGAGLTTVLVWRAMDDIGEAGSLEEATA